MTRSLLFPPSRDNLIPLETPGLPPAIDEANRAAHAAFDGLKEAKIARKAAREQERTAARTDQLAAAAAIAAGAKDPKPTEADKAAAALEAERRVETLDLATRQAIRALYDAIEAHRDEYMAALEASREDAVAQLRDMVPELVTRIVAVRETNKLYGAALKWHNNPASAALNSGGGKPGHLADQVRRSMERQRAWPRPAIASIHDLLAALALMIETDIAGGGKRKRTSDAGAKTSTTPTSASW